MAVLMAVFMAVLMTVLMAVLPAVPKMKTTEARDAKVARTLWSRNLLAA